MRRILLCVFALTATGLLLEAADSPSSLTGDWDLTYTNSEGSHSALMRLEQTGERVKGTVRGDGLSDGVIEGRLQEAKFEFSVRFYDSRRRLGNPTGCTATVEAGSLKGFCREHRQNWAGKRKS